MKREEIGVSPVSPANSEPQRRDKVRTMQWSDIRNGTWTIRTAEREKSNAEKLALPELALQIIEAQPRFVGNDYVFAAGKGAIDNMSWHKAAIYKASNTVDWRLHDLRRSARSLMSRAGVLSEHAERVLGHAIRGVEGIYDRHAYDNEKAAALTALAALIERILAGPTDNVLPMHGATVS